MSPAPHKDKRHIPLSGRRDAPHPAISFQILTESVMPMKQLLKQLNTIPEVAELVRREEEGGCPAAGRKKRRKFVLGAA